jgi:hypothetical protein
MAGSLKNFDGLENTVFVETGTFYGDTVQAAVNSGAFQRIHSIELSSDLFGAARRRFKNQHPKVVIHHGRSVDVLPKIIDPSLSTTFLLDAHKTIEGDEVRGSFVHGAECPLMGELLVVFRQRWRTLPTIVVDDVRMFGDEWWDEGQYNEQFERDRWPRLEHVIRFIQHNGMSAMIIDDRIIAKGANV